MNKKSHDVKLLVFDVDGTLVNDNQELGKKTIDAIKKVQEKGIAVTLATGKIFPSVESVIRALEIKIPLILANGAVVQKPDKEVIFGQFLDVDFVDAITKYDHNYGCELALFISDNIFVKEENYNTEHITEMFREKVEAVGEWAAVKDHFSEMCKAIWINRLNRENVGKLTEMLENRYGGKVSLSAGSPESIEAMPAGVSKQAGLMHLVDYLHIPVESVMAFGDQQNDMGILEAAGTAVAVENAIDSVKAISNYVVGSNNEEGPAQFLADHFSL